MLAYRKSDFDALARSEAAARWAKDPSLDEAAAKALAGRFPSPFYTPNEFIRIGLFIFGSICAMAALGLFYLMTGIRGTSNDIGILLVVFGAGMMLLLETLLRRDKPFFRAGLEEAILYGALLSLISGFLVLIRFKSDPNLALALFLGIVCAAAALRYADSLLAAVALGWGFHALFHACEGLGNRAGYVLPMLVIAISALMVKASGWALRQDGLRYWEHLWKVLRFLALLTCYAGGNYFVVREMSHALFGLSLEEHQDIPMAMAFYIYTFGLPLFYIAFGMAKRERLFLNAGLLIFAMAVFTYKYYHHVMSVEMGLTLAGFALIGIAWIALKAFKSVRYGITAAAQQGSSRSGFLNVESLALLKTFGSKDAPPQAPEGYRGGGGNFGGGGASGNF